METVYFESEFCHLSLEKERGLGVAVLKGFLNREQYQEAFRRGVDMIREHQLDKFLLDNRQMKAIRQADQLWTVEVVLRELSRTPLKQVAVIRSADMFNRMAVRDMYQQADASRTFEGRSFDGEYQAMRWLETSATPTVADQKAPNKKSPE